ncbi:hypothetical protein OCU04_012595 [Sclerotinia nivalis]|uniref:beta-glucosidase n=1 Tax=Sclerotinia nivalis TaxID=352851 RepID=A0A9X0A928_9HELO|nr:hypothetical protein OCU04_012595 [Sclerotinia nivalis]
MSTRRVLSLALFASGSLVSRSIAYNIMNKSYFDNDSPPIYPSPIGTGTPLWKDSYVKAMSMIDHMTTEEKSKLTTGAMNTGNGCSGIIPAIPRVGFPGMCFQDSGNGVRGVEFSSSFPSGIHVGASWNKTLAYQRASVMAGEFRALGVNVVLGPVVGPLGRVAQGGRNWEGKLSISVISSLKKLIFPRGFSNDPYLCGSLASETVYGIQAQGVIASTKHFIGYEQETNRNPVTSMPELGFNGFVVSDWDAQHSGFVSALSGLDVAMVLPGYEVFWGPNLTTAVNNNSMPISRLDDMATR